MKLKVKTKFSAAHFLENYDGQCANIHGHTWLVSVTLSVADPLPNLYYEGVTLDFKRIKAKLDSLLPDHQFLNEVLPFNPTAENIALWLLRTLSDEGWPVTEVTVWESADAAATATL
jgi:6-pyruvoyltetrahydropterin/6-carboxytetrahydropterin synthase